MIKRPVRVHRSGHVSSFFHQKLQKVNIYTPCSLYSFVLSYKWTKLRKEVTDMGHVYISVDIDDLIYGERDGTVSER